MESPQKKKIMQIFFKPYTWMTLYILGIIIFTLIDEKFLVPNLLISLATLIYIYHLKSSGESIRGIKIDNTYVIPIFIVFISLASWSLSRTDSENVYKQTEADQVLDCEKTGTYTDADGVIQDCELVEERDIFWKSTKAITIYIIIAGCIFVFYEIARKSGTKEALSKVVTILSICGILLVTSIILLNIGQNTDDQTKSSDLELKDIRLNYIFKGGIGGLWDLIEIENSKIIYNGDPTQVMIQKGSTEENIYCSVENSGKENKLWRCGEESFNRIESKCGGDWWISSDKGCLTDSLSEMYRVLYLLIIFILVGVSLFSMIQGGNFYSIDTFKPLIMIYIFLFLYHLVYFISNYIVSWTHDEAILFQDYLSEFLKGDNGNWSDDIACDEKFKETKSDASSKMGDSDETHKDIEIKYETIWSKEGVTPKLKVLFNLILLIVIMIYFIRFIMKKYGINIVENTEVLGKNSKNIFKYLIIIIVSLTMSQFVYMIYSTLIADDCIIKRITGKNKIDDPLTQEYCIGKTPDKDDECRDIGRKYECSENENCKVNNSYNMNELLRCQFDSHGGMYYHIICLLFIPIIFILIKSTSVLDYIK